MTFSNLDPISSYDVRFLCILYGRKARAESYNFRVEIFSKIGPKTAPNRWKLWQFLEATNLPHLTHVKLKYYLFNSQKSGPPIKSALFILLFPPNQTQNSFLSFSPQKKPFLFKFHRCCKQFLVGINLNIEGKQVPHPCIE